MARKWSVVCNFVQAFFLSLIAFWTNLWTRQGRRRIGWVLGLGALLLVLGSSPGVAQQTEQTNGLTAHEIESSIRNLEAEGNYSEAIQKLEGAVSNKTLSVRHRAILQVNLGRLYSELGRQVLACRHLKEALGVNADICNEHEGTSTQGVNFQTSWVNGPLRSEDKTKVKSLRIFGDILRNIGELDASQQVLDQAIKLAKTIEANDLRPSLSMSLGNTYRALGNLERDRSSIPQYDYLPWRFQKREAFKNLNTSNKLDVFDGLDVAKSLDIFERLDIFDKTLKTYQKAIVQYQSILNTEGNTILSQTAKLNQLSTLIDEIELIDEVSLERTLLLDAIQLEANLDFAEISNESLDKSSNLRIYGQIALARNRNYLRQAIEQADLQCSNLSSESNNIIQACSNLMSSSPLEDLELALNQASKIKDQSARRKFKAYILGEFGGFYEYSSSINRKDIIFLKEALQKTQEALYLIQSEQEPLIAYHLYWQMGRLLDMQSSRYLEQANGGTAKSTELQATKFYEKAISELESVRDNLQSINPDIQYSFRDDVEPVYRGLVDLLLREPPNNIQERNNNQSINETKAQSLINELQLSELENFLQCRLNRDRRVSINRRIAEDESSSTLAVYPIILKDRLEVIVTSADNSSLKKLRRYRAEDITSLEVEMAIRLFRYFLEKPIFRYEGQEVGNLLYQWIISPLETDNELHLKQNNTIAFVLDGALRNIPMAALYKDDNLNDDNDGQFLLEKYNIVISTGLYVPLYKRETKFTALITGQSQEIKDKELPSLAGVGDEVNTITQNLREAEIKVEKLLDKQLTYDTLRKTLSQFPYSVVHMATHGQFSSDLQETYIIPAPKEEIDLNELEELLKLEDDKTVELLVLSACETSDGDRRAILGLTGVTIRAGVRSTLGSLWSVNDQSTAALMEEFYKQLASGKLTKAEALRQAQLTFLTKTDEYSPLRSPLYWSPFILVGDWQTKMVL